MTKYWEVKMKADRVGELLLYGDIASAQMWGDEITPIKIDADLKALGDIDTLNVHICSGGGSVFAGQAIYSIIKRHGAAEKNAYIDGLAASMASIIPLACNKIYMQNGSLIMIHRPFINATGTADIMRQRADFLDRVEGEMIDIYAEKIKLDKDKIKELLAAETWLTAQEALAIGFIDEIEQDLRIAASLDGDFLVFGDVKADTKVFKNFKPEMYRESLTPTEPVADKPPDLTEQIKNNHRIMDKIYKTYEEEN